MSFVCTRQIGSLLETIFWKVVWKWLTLEFPLSSLGILIRSLTGLWIVVGRTLSMTLAKVRWPFGIFFRDVVSWTFGATFILLQRVLRGRARTEHVPHELILLGAPLCGPLLFLFVTLFHVLFPITRPSISRSVHLSPSHEGRAGGNVMYRLLMIPT